MHGDTKIARDGNSLTKLKNVIKNLVKNKELSEKVNVFIESETKLDSEELFLEFKNRLKDVINQYRWN